jgi:hypothetical protein
MTNFWQALDMLDTDTTVVSPLVYRLYYDEITGKPLCYSMEDLQGTYITVSQQEFNVGNYHVFVKDGKIVPIETRGYNKLVPSSTGTACHPSNVMIVDATKSKYWSLKTYESE